MFFACRIGVHFQTGENYEGNYYVPTSNELRKAAKIAYCGWYQPYGRYGSDGVFENEKLKYYAFTQQYIWEVLGQSSATFVDGNIQNEYLAYRTEIINKMNQMQTRPSFDATTITIESGETKTLTDTNGVLSSYASVNTTRDGITFVHNEGENTMTISLSEDVEIEHYKFTDSIAKQIGLIKGGTQDEATTVYIEFADGVQDQLYSLNYNDPVPLAFELGIEALGSIKLNKLDTNKDLVDGAVFTVSGPGYNGDVLVRGGEIILDNIKKGTYQISEKSVGTGYLLNKEIYTVNVESGKTATQAIINKEPTGEITITKTDIETGNSNRIDRKSHHGDATLKGTEYTLYASSDIYNVARKVKYFSKDEPIATFTFDEYGVANIRIINSSTPAKISIRGNTLIGLPMGRIL